MIIMITMTTLTMATMMTVAIMRKVELFTRKLKVVQTVNYSVTKESIKLLGQQKRTKHIK